MGRLTFKKWFEHFNFGKETTTICADGYTQIVERDLLTYDKPHYYLAGEAIDKLAEYEDLEEQGLLLRLPCKVGDVAYYVHREYLKNADKWVNVVDEVEVDSFAIYQNLLVNVSLRIGEDRFRKTLTPYKTLFFSQAEAEAALERMGAE